MQVHFGIGIGDLIGCGVPARHDGVNLPDAEIAYRYVCDVVRELMKGREPATRSWQLEVYEGGHDKIFEIPLVHLDQTVDHLDAPMREANEHSAQQIRSVKDKRQAVRFVPKQHHWMAEALDDGLRLAVVVESVKPGWIFRRAKFVGTRIIVLYDGR